jgi:RNA polymerase sigma-70 factor, ECF subfamily
VNALSSGDVGDGGDAHVAVFEAARSRLTGRAYRIVGVLADADDIVQDAWVRWSAADRVAVDNPDAWLNTVVARLALDRLRARHREQERYVGPWLPSPLVERIVDPAEQAELAESLTVAFLLALERLTPDERAAFLLADVFGERFADVADTMNRSVESCRQLASRARAKLRDRRDVAVDRDRVAATVVERFIVALSIGDIDTAIGCLAPDAVYLSDGGAAVRAARRPVRGADRIVRLLDSIHRRHGGGDPAPAWVGGCPGIVVSVGDRIVYTLACEVSAGRITRVTSVLNPEKLVAIARGRSTLG